MLIRNWIALLLFVIAGFASGVMYKMQFHYPETIFATQSYNQKYWNPAESWKNKFKNDDPWQGEAYSGSTTVFAFATDGWNLLKFLMIGTMILASLAFMPYSQFQGRDRAEVWLLNFLSFAWITGAFYIGSVLGSRLI